MYDTMNSSPRTPILQGWLEKQKSSSSILGSNTNRRWFTIDHFPMDASYANEDDHELRHHNNTDVSKEELVLSYYKSSSYKEKSGWIFLSDVTNVTERIEYDGNKQTSWIHICHPSRIFKLRGETHADHTSWLTTLQRVCNLKNEDVNGFDSGDFPDKGDNLNSVLSSKNLIQPAAATYKRESFSCFESNNLISMIGNSNHKAEIDFMRELTSPRSNLKHGDLKSRKYHRNHRSNLLDDDIATREGSLVSPSYHENLTTSGIEQKSELSSYQNNSLINDDTFLNKNEENNLFCGNHEEHLETKEHQCFNNYKKSFTAIDSTSDVIIDHRLYLNSNGKDADETICKRLGRAILSPSHSESDECKSVNKVIEMSNNQNDIYQQETAMSLTNCSVTMVETISDDDDNDYAYSGDSFATPNTAPVQDKKSNSYDMSKENNEQEKYDNIISKLHDYFPSPNKLDFGDEWGAKQSPVAKPCSVQEQISFETDCSYLPDSNFVDEDWD